MRFPTIPDFDITELYCMWGNIYISTGGNILQYTLPAIFYKNGFSSMPSGCILYHFNINLRASPESADSIFVFLFRNTWPEACFFFGNRVVWCSTVARSLQWAASALRSFCVLLLQHDTHSFRLHLYSENTPVSKEGIARAWPVWFFLIFFLCVGVLWCHQNNSLKINRQ